MRMRNRPLLRLTTLSLLTVLFTGAFATPDADAQVRRRRHRRAAPTQQAVNAKGQPYTLEATETLHSLSAKFLGSPAKWKQIRRLNTRTLPKATRNNPNA